MEFLQLRIIEGDNPQGHKIQFEIITMGKRR